MPLMFVGNKKEKEDKKKNKNVMKGFINKKVKERNKELDDIYNFGKRKKS